MSAHMSNLTLARRQLVSGNIRRVSPEGQIKYSKQPKMETSGNRYNTKKVSSKTRIIYFSVINMKN